MSTREDVHEHGASGRAANGLRHLNVQLTTHLEHRAADNTRKRRHRENGNTDHDVGDARTDDGHDGDGEQDAREREHNVTNAHDKGVDNAAKKAGDKAKDDTRSGTDNRSGKRRTKRQLRAGKDAAKDISAKLIGAPQMPTAGGPAKTRCSRTRWDRARRDVGSDHEQESG